MSDRTKIINDIVNILTKENKSVFLTGAAGTGKTQMAIELCNILEDQGHRVARTATTHIAAEHIEGVTIYSLVDLIMENITEETYPDLNDIDRYIDWDRAEAIVNTDILMIDEISMMNDVNFDMLVTTLKRLTTKYAYYQYELRTSPDVLSTIIDIFKSEDYYVDEVQAIIDGPGTITDRMKKISELKSYDIALDRFLLGLAIGDVSRTLDDESIGERWIEKSELAERSFTGYIRLVLIGDLLQLVPWNTNQLSNYIIYSRFFNSDNIKTITLTESIRHRDDPEFASILDKIRMEKITPDVVEFLRSRSYHKYSVWDDHIELSVKTSRSSKSKDSITYESIDEIYLEVYQNRLNELPNNYRLEKQRDKIYLRRDGEEDIEYSMRYTQSLPNLFKKNIIQSADQCWYDDKKYILNITSLRTLTDRISNQLRSDKILDLEVGSRVIVTKDTWIDEHCTIHQGEIGEIMSTLENEVAIRIKRDREVIQIKVPRVPFVTYSGNYRYIRWQIPLRPVESLYVHGCQGMTLSRGVIDLSNEHKLYEYRPGMAYTALSRFRTSSQLILRGRVNCYNIHADSTLVKYYNGESIEEELNEYQQEKIRILSERNS